MTPQRCRALALGSRFRFYAVQNTTCCYAGSVDPTYYKQRKEGCVAACAGDAALRCGGELENMVYRIPDVNGEYAGCYQGNVLTATRSMTLMMPTACREWALGMAFNHWGMQAPNVCRGQFMKVSVPVGTLVSNQTCAEPCDGDHKQACGGGQGVATAVFKVATDDPAGECAFSRMPCTHLSICVGPQVPVSAVCHD
mgnify:FL=1